MLTLFLLTALVVSCVDSGDIEIQDSISHIYYLEGPRVIVGGTCIRCPADQDSLKERVSFSVIAKLDHDNTEKIQFYIVEGADTGEIGKRVFPDCNRSADCEVFGKIVPSGEFVVSGGAFEIDIENNGHRYKGRGFLSPARINLKGQYSYEDITIDYDLNGERFFLTLE